MNPSLPCPSCGSFQSHLFLRAQDHTVSGEWFDVMICEQCSLKFTANPPDEAAIAPYYSSQEYISHSDTQKGTINRLYHLVRKRTLMQKQKLVRKISGKDTGRILDIGCGTGAFLNTMRSAGWQVTGVEQDTLARENARQLYNIAALPASSLRQFDSESFDVITLWHVLEHVHDLHGYMEAMTGMLRHDGKILIAVPNHNADDARHYGPAWAAWDVPRHLYHFNPQSMDKLMSLHGLKIVRTLPMWFDSFYVSLLSEKYRNGKSGMLSGFYRGMVSNIKAIRNQERASSLIYVAEQ